MSSVDPSAGHRHLEVEYAEINGNFRHLADIRFKLIAFLPVLGGVAVFALSLAGFSATAARHPAPDAILWLVVAVSMFGFAATLGVTTYDQRNSELYNALIHRAKFLEREFRSEVSPGSLRPDASSGGHFNERPPRGRKLFKRWSIGHDTALALVYGPVLGGWVFPAAFSLLRLTGLPARIAVPAATLATLWAAVMFTRELVRLDAEDHGRWTAAWTRDTTPKRAP